VGAATAVIEVIVVVEAEEDSGEFCYSNSC
jgi:hypothetical protein